MREVERPGRYTDESTNTPAAIAAMGIIGAHLPKQNLHKLCHDLPPAPGRHPGPRRSRHGPAHRISAVQGWTDRIAGEVTCGSQFVNQLRDGGPAAPVDVALLVDDVVASRQLTATAAVQLVCDATAPGLVDRAPLFRAVDNLGDNAVHAARAHRLVEVAIRDWDQHVSVTVDGNASGFDCDRLSRLETRA